MKKKLDILEGKVLGIKELMIGTRNYNCNRLLIDFDFQEKSIVY